MLFCFRYNTESGQKSQPGFRCTTLCIGREQSLFVCPLLFATIEDAIEQSTIRGDGKLTHIFMKRTKMPFFYM